MTKYFVSAIRFLLRAICYIYRSIYGWFIHYSIRSCGKNITVWPRIKIYGGNNINIGKNVIIRKNTTIAAQVRYHNQQFSPTITIEDNVDLGEHCFITAINEIIIGEGTTTGRMVTITDNSHGDTTIENMEKHIPERILFSKGRVCIGKKVWIGDKATILPNVTIGDGAIIGANAVVSKDIPPYCIAAGNPARIIKNLNNG